MIAWGCSHQVMTLHRWNSNTYIYWWKHPLTRKIAYGTNWANVWFIFHFSALLKKRKAEERGLAPYYFNISKHHLIEKQCDDLSWWLFICGMEMKWCESTVNNNNNNKTYSWDTKWSVNCFALLLESHVSYCFLESFILLISIGPKNNTALPAMKGFFFLRR